MTARLQNRFHTLVEHMLTRELADLPVMCVQLPRDGATHIDLEDHDVATLLRWAETLRDARFTVVAGPTLSYVAVTGDMISGQPASVQTTVDTLQLSRQEAFGNTITAERLRRLIAGPVAA